MLKTALERLPFLLIVEGTISPQLIAAGVEVAAVIVEGAIPP
ncbi:hypothetical protein WL1483_633 [Aeromonas schubertii]|uniref:Uncharacterized protein n=1 Tax=Aeromonas schubertii TaxID=652 RepID=A0A0S2SED7_9GAMM|nr:hypothetical protein WL1483_633 [Aeromonas schubertii]